jgi:hypothetical protein
VENPDPYLTPNSATARPLARRARRTPSRRIESRSSGAATTLDLASDVTEEAGSVTRHRSVLIAPSCHSPRGRLTRRAVGSANWITASRIGPWT